MKAYEVREHTNRDGKRVLTVFTSPEEVRRMLEVQGEHNAEIALTIEVDPEWEPSGERP